MQGEGQNQVHLLFFITGTRRTWESSQSSYPFSSKLNWLFHAVTEGISGDVKGEEVEAVRASWRERNRGEGFSQCCRPDQKSNGSYERCDLLFTSWGLEKHIYGSLVLY